jgi:hypothetical protein
MPRKYQSCSAHVACSDHVSVTEHLTDPKRAHFSH